MDDVLKHKAQGTFDLDTFVQGRGYPTNKRTLFTDADSAYELGQVNQRMAEIAQDKAHSKEPLKSEYASLEKQAAVLREKIIETSLIFHLRGISPGHIKKVAKDVSVKAEKEDLSQDEVSDLLNYRWFAPHIIRVEKSDGSVDEGPFTPEIVETLEHSLPKSEWMKLNDAIAELSFQATYFDQAVDAGFLPKS